MHYRSQQTRTKGTTFKAVMKTAPFVRGVKEARAGKPLEYDAYTQTNQQWAYERGRQFGLLFDGPVKEGQRVRAEAISAIRDLTANHIIF